MTDIVERLRACPGVRDHDPCNCLEAADEIERLIKEASDLQACLNVAARLGEKLKADNKQLRAALTHIAGIEIVNAALKPKP